MLEASSGFCSRSSESNETESDSEFELLETFSFRALRSLLLSFSLSLNSYSFFAAMSIVLLNSPHLILALNSGTRVSGITIFCCSLCLSTMSCSWSEVTESGLPLSGVLRLVCILVNYYTDNFSAYLNQSLIL